MNDCEFDFSKLALQFREVMPSRLEMLDATLERVMQQIRRMPLSQENLDEVTVALSEALANAIIHGNRKDPDKKVEICGACEDGNKLLLVITDEGEGFDPSKIPDPTTADNLYSHHGRGIYLINGLMDQTEFRKGGRQVVLRKRLKPGD